MIDLDDFRNCLRDVLDASSADLAADAALETVPGWDSVNALRVLTNVEAAFGVRLPLHAFVEAKTVGGLFQLVRDGEGHGRAS